MTILDCTWKNSQTRPKMVCFPLLKAEQKDNTRGSAPNIKLALGRGCCCLDREENLFFSMRWFKCASRFMALTVANDKALCFYLQQTNKRDPTKRIQKQKKPHCSVFSHFFFLQVPNALAESSGCWVCRPSWVRSSWSVAYRSCQLPRGRRRCTSGRSQGFC